jgi:ferredoxin
MVDIQTQARKMELDVLGVEIISIQGVGLEKAKILLTAAVAKARGYAGSEPENARPYFSTKVSRRALFKLSALEYRAVPCIRESQCAADIGCKVCVKVCPNGALEWSGGTPERSNGKVHYDKMKCEPCGLCVTACPRGAIIDPVITPVQLEAQISTLLDPAVGNIKSRGILFTCQRVPNPEKLCHEGWMPVKLPCVGMALSSWFLAPLMMGASAVAVLPCGRGCSVGQTRTIKGRIAYCQEFLRLIGASEDLVRLSQSLDQPPPESGKGVSLETPFSHKAIANVFLRIAQEYDADEVVIEHPNSPLGIVEVRGDVCTGCGICAKTCPTGALLHDVGDEDITLTFDTARCVACGQCLSKCPEVDRNAISLSKRTDLGCIGQGRTPIYREDTLQCIACSDPIAPVQMIKRIEKLLGSEYTTATSILTRYCPTCRSTVAFHG